MWNQEGKHFVYSTYNMVSVSRKCSTPRTMSSRDLCMGFSSTVLLRVVCPKKSTGTTKVLARDNLVKNWFFSTKTFLIYRISHGLWWLMIFIWWGVCFLFPSHKEQNTRGPGATLLTRATPVINLIKAPSIWSLIQIYLKNLVEYIILFKINLRLHIFLC